MLVYTLEAHLQKRGQSVFASMAGDARDLIFEKIRPSLEDDELRQYQKFLSANGKGRPPKLKSRPPTFRLLLQLELLRQTIKCTWQEVGEVFNKVTEGDPLQGLSLKSEVEGVVKEARRIADTDLPAFLECNLVTSISSRHIGMHLANHGILRQHLLEPAMLPRLDKITNGIVLDLLNFSRHVSNVNKRQVLQSLGADLSSVSDAFLNKCLRRANDENSKLRKNCHKEAGRQKYELFLAKPFSTLAQLPQLPAAEQRRGHHFSPDQRALGIAQQTIRALRGAIQEKELALQEIEKAKNDLSNFIKDKNDTIVLLKYEIEKQRNTAQILAAKLQKTTAKLHNLQEEVKTIRQANFYKRLKRQENNLRKREATILAHEQGGCNRKLTKLRRDKKLLQTKVSNYKQQLERVQVTSGHKIQQLQVAVQDLMTGEQEPAEKVVKLKDDQGGDD